MIWIASWGIENINYLITWDHFRCACPCVFNLIVFFLRMYLDNFKWAPAKQNDPFRYVLCTTISRLHCQHLSKASREISSFFVPKNPGLIERERKTRWWLLNSLWQLFWLCIFSTLSSWNHKPLFHLLVLHNFSYNFNNSMHMRVLFTSISFLHT